MSLKPNLLSLQARRQLIKQREYHTEFTFLAHPKNRRHHARVFIHKTPGQEAKFSLNTFPNITYNRLRLDEENLEAYINEEHINANDIASHLRETFQQQLNHSYLWDEATKHLLAQDHKHTDKTALADKLGERLTAYKELEKAYVTNPTPALQPIYDELRNGNLAAGKEITNQSINKLLENTQIPKEIEKIAPREYLYELALRN